MEPMLPTLLFCQFSFEPISKGFHITILTQRVIFSSENISPMVPFIYRMAFDIGVVWEIQRLYIIFNSYSFLKLFLGNMAILHEIVDNSFHVCNRREEPGIIYVYIAKCK